jgi:hypothetical protein
MASRWVDIAFRGKVGDDLAADLQQFTVRDEGVSTRLIGSVQDQSELLGILNLLDQLRAEILSVNPTSPLPQDVRTE